MHTLNRKTLIITGIMFVVIFLLTWLISVPLGIERNGESAKAYLNLGDAGIMLAVALLGGPWAALAAALGSALGDLVVGSAVYILPTLIIKAVMAFVAATLIKKDSSFLGAVRTVTISGLWMTIGYFIYDLIFMGDFVCASALLVLNLLQVVANGVIAVPLLKLLGGKSQRQAQQATMGRVK